jgi:2-C-methyl-D-erythritol 2,4-cyclodiphosphate synthase
MYRIGFGYDVHRLVENRKLILGGVDIPFEKGLLGHSDADVLVHSIIDAILGSLSLGDIGTLFSDQDMAYKDINSRILLKKTHEIMTEKGYRIGNLDATICAQSPKMQPYITEMRQNIAIDLHCDLCDISVKATTEEHLGISGSQDGMTAYCVVILTHR